MKYIHPYKCKKNYSPITRQNIDAGKNNEKAATSNICFKRIYLSLWIGG